MQLARRAAWGQFVFMLIAFVALTHSFINNDFSLVYVANNSNSALPLQYRISAVWGAHEGSLLLWGFILAIWTVAVASFSRSLPLATVARVISVMGLISIGFLLFMLLTSNPFDRIPLENIPQDGRDLNPLLQDIGLVLHPPMLYMAMSDSLSPLPLPLRRYWVAAWMPPGHAGPVPGLQLPGFS